MRRRSNPSAKVVGLSVGVLALGGAAVWYFLLRKKQPVAYPMPTLAQQASSPSGGPVRPMTTAAMTSLATLAQQLQTASK